MTTETERRAREAVRVRGIGGQFAHLWSDALFAREQARSRSVSAQRLEAQIAQAQADGSAHADKSSARSRAELSQTTWDRGAYVRWTVMSAWTVFEKCCADAVDDPNVTFRIRKRLPAAIAHKTQQNAVLNWTDPLWQAVDDLREERNRYVHRALVDADLFAPSDAAERAVVVVRSGVVEVYRLVGKAHPSWVECDMVPPRLGGSMAWASVQHAGADADPRRLRIVGLHGGSEWESRVLRSDEDPWPEVEALAKNTLVPISAIRIYEGPDLREELIVRMRGS